MPPVAGRHDVFPPTLEVYPASETRKIEAIARIGAACAYDNRTGVGSHRFVVESTIASLLIEIDPAVTGCRDYDVARPCSRYRSIVDRLGPLRWAKTELRFGFRAGARLITDTCLLLNQYYITR